jgi:hypothetical protein
MALALATLVPCEPKLWERLWGFFYQYLALWGGRH